jgi:hypothetical protein
MSTPNLENLIQRLNQFPAETSFDDVVAAIRPPEPSNVAEVKRRCALVRWFDSSLYDFLASGISSKPDFNSIIAIPGVERFAPGKWAIEEGERARLLQSWRSNQTEWRDWNTKIGNYCLAQGGPDMQLNAAYHLAASTQPDILIPYFQKWFDAAAAVFDMAHCNALLEMLRLQDSWRGPALSKVWLDFQYYYSAHMLYADSYYKTGAYLERQEAFKNFASVLNREHGPRPWIFHLYAAGGAGKTMFLRWLISRYLIPARILSARVDFDDFRLDEIVKFPVRLFLRIVKQLSQQPHGAALSSLLGRLEKEQQTTGWNADVETEIRRQFRGSRISTPIVIMLDTLEEATTSAAAWLGTCIDSLRKLHDILPSLTLVLSGRYDIATRCQAFQSAEALIYELLGFTNAEAHLYLERRGIPSGPLRDAIVLHSAVDDNHRKNPFKLSLMVELVLNRAKPPEADEILRYDRPNVAYLMQRVIHRIESQTVRWIVRYGVIARRLTEAFTQEVLVPPLLRALRGESTDTVGLGLDDVDKDAWKPDPAAAADIAQNGIKSYWDKLELYAADRGWLNSIIVNGETVLRFHPEVINPTLDLLRKQKGLFNQLQEAAVAFYLQQPGTIGDNLQEAIFHKFQLDGTAAEQFWIDRVYETEALFGAAAAVPLAAEIVGREYAEAEKIPFPSVSSPELLIRAHCETADLLLQAAGTQFVYRRNWPEFSRHVELALAIAGNDSSLTALIPFLLPSIFRAWSFSADDAIRQNLRGFISHAKSPRDQFFLNLQLGQILLGQVSSEGLTFVREALRLLPDAGRTSILADQIHLELANYFEFIGDHESVLETYKDATRSTLANDRSRARVLSREVSYALFVGDLPLAERQFAQMQAIPAARQPSLTYLDLLEALLALAKLDPFAALQGTARGIEHATDDSDHARILDLQAEARALQFDFRGALDTWELASSRYDRAGTVAGSARCALLAGLLKAQVIGNYNDAETTLLSASNLRGSEDIGIRTEIELGRAFVCERLGKRDEAVSIIDQLLARPVSVIPPRIQSRVLIFALVFGLRKADDDILRDIDTSVDRIQPISLRESVLDWIEYSHLRVEVPREFVRKLRGHFAPHSPQALQLPIKCADLYRIFGMVPEAEAELADSPDTDLLPAWRANLARRRLGVPTSFGPLVRRFQESQFIGTPLYEAVRTAAAWEALHNEGVTAAHAAAPGDLQINPQDLPSIWQARRLDLLVELASPADRLALQKQAEDMYRLLGQAAQTVTPQGKARVIAPQNLPALLMIPTELMIDNIMGSWLLFVDEVTTALRANNAENAPIEVTGPLAAIPWEFAGVTCRQSPKAPSTPYPPQNSRLQGAIQIITPAGGEEEISFGTGSGSQLEDVYSGLGLSPIVYRTRGDASLVKDMFAGIPPVLLHIVAALREASHGTYLDFASTSHRTEIYSKSFDTTTQVDDLSLSAFSLDRMLSSYPVPPFVILDIGRPYNITEALRMLFLRNLFATQLFELGHARGILACGLADSNERLALSSLCVAPLMQGTVTDAIKSLRAGGPGGIEFVLPRLGAAPWTNRPDDRLFDL